MNSGTINLILVSIIVMVATAAIGIEAQDQIESIFQFVNSKI